MSGSDFLYPFLTGAAEDDVALLADLAASATSKAEESRALCAASLAHHAGGLAAAAAAIAARVKAGGRIFTFGNGGSATDAAALADRFLAGAAAVLRPLQARALVDTATVTALGNDVGFELVFARQLIAIGRPDDVAIGLSTSGSSPNLLAAFAEARRRGMLTIGFAGYRGGAMATADLDHCFVVGSDSVHRIQEAQDALGDALCRLVVTAPVGSP